MKELLIIIICISVGLFFIIKAKKLRTKSQSKLYILEHPSAFEKPHTEMVSNTSGENEILTNSKIIYHTHLKTLST